MLDIMIIGGGAAGLMAALSAKQYNPTLKIAIAERNDRVGKKLALTGNGRCNISNKNISTKNYHGTNKDFCKWALNDFDVKQTEEFFGQLGVVFKEGEKGKLYPYSLQASSVVDALRFGIQKQGIELITQEEISTIKAMPDGTYKVSGNKSYSAHAVIVASGGKSGGKIASDSGYSLLTALGHTLTPISPAIVQIKTENTATRQLKGVKVDAKATVIKKGTPIISDFGEVLFCDYGLSGPPILQLSRYLEKGDEVSLDLMPEYSNKELVEMLYNRVIVLGEITVSDYFTGLLHKRLGQVILKSLGLSLNDLVAADYKLIIRIAGCIKDFRFTFLDTNGFNNAQVTHGGIKTDEFFNDTLMSKKHSGLFAAGEVLDIDGDCGGYNLQWAWSSGYTSGLSAAKFVEGEL